MKFNMQTTEGDEPLLKIAIVQSISAVLSIMMIITMQLTAFDRYTSSECNNATIARPFFVRVSCTLDRTWHDH